LKHPRIGSLCMQGIAAKQLKNRNN
jgi:hypothetical protein